MVMQMKILTEIEFLAMVIVVLITVTAADIERLYFCDDIPSCLSDWDDNFSIQKFDPMLGDLKEVSFQLDMNTTQDVLFENKGSLSGEVTLNSEIELLVTTPNSEVVSFNDSIKYHDDIDSFDGVIDFSGTSGFAISGIKANNSVTYSYSEISDFIAESPSDATIDLPVMSRSTVQIRGVTDYSGKIKTFLGSKLCVVYTYDPKTITLGDR